MEISTKPIEFRVLGPVEVARDGKTIGLGGTRQRALLALLLLEPGRPVPAERIAEELWNGDPPAGASTTVRSYVSRLRTALGSAAPVAGGAEGYAVRAEPALVDSFVFEQLTRDAEDALGRGAVTRAAERLRDAMALWRGRPFGELANEGMLQLEADRLEELRMHALELRIDADLALGRDAEIVDELERLVEEHPCRERLWQQLMLALYRAERQADALAAYARARTILDDELGLEPGEELKRLEPRLVEQRDAIAYEFGDYALEVRSGDDRVVDRGTYALVHERQRDGRWLRAVELLTPVGRASRRCRSKPVLPH